MRDMDKISQSAVREINRKLQNEVRNDWDFSATSSQQQHTTLVKDGARYRERYYGTTDDSSDENGFVSAQSLADMYAFDSPDSVGEDLDRKLAERRKRKRMDMEEELRVNPGLCFFQRRRNAWTGAVARDSRREDGGSAMEGVRVVKKQATSSDSSPMHTPTSASSSTVVPPVEQLSQSLLVTNTAPQPPPPQLGPAFRHPENPTILTDVLVPVAPPIIPASNTIRITMAHRSPSEIYGKVVRDSRTPAIPINLADMTRIIVHGWKDEGNWPPRGSAPEAALAARRRTLAMDGAVESHGLFAHHPHLQRGVEGVKRVFRLSGGHHGGSAEEVKSPKNGKGPGLESAFRSHE